MTTGILLAGGKSSRMGRDKALLELGGRTLAERVLSVLHSVFDEVIVVTDDPARYAHAGARVLCDGVEDGHALGALYTGLDAAHSEHCFATACDMPFLQERLVEYIARGDTADAAAPFVDGRWHPLCARYSKACLAPMRAQLREGDCRLSRLLERVHAQRLTREQLAPFDPQLRSLMNLNTPEEYRRAQSMPGIDEMGI